MIFTGTCSQISLVLTFLEGRVGLKFLPGLFLEHLRRSNVSVCVPLLEFHTGLLIERSKQFVLTWTCVCVCVSVNLTITAKHLYRLSCNLDST